MATVGVEGAVPAVGAPVGVVFEYVYARYFARVCREISFKVSDRATAEDVAQEMFAKLWQEMSGGLVIEKPDRALRFLCQRAAWALSAHFATHATRQARRESALEELPPPVERAATLASAAPGPETQVPARLDLSRTLALLPPAQRRVIALRYLEDLSYEQVAEQTATSTKTVNNHLSRGLATLRRAEGLPERTTAGIRKEAADVRAQALALYRESVAAGSPLAYTELGARFGRTAQWAIRTLRAGGAHESRLSTVRTDARMQLREELAAGAWTPGEQVTSRTLAARFPGLHTSSAGQILTALHTERLLDKRPISGPHKVGYFVPAPPLAPIPGSGSYLVTGRTPTGADTFPTARVAA
jgi:RNA polymerase sigma-70 factor (ECF subfamily)